MAWLMLSLLPLVQKCNRSSFFVSVKKRSLLTSCTINPMFYWA